MLELSCVLGMNWHIDADFKLGSQFGLTWALGRRLIPIHVWHVEI